MSKYGSILTAEVVINLIKDSKSIAEVIKKAGLSSVGSPHYRRIHRIIKEYNIDLSHMTGQGWNKGKTHPEQTQKSLEKWLQEDTDIGSSSLKKKLFKVKRLKQQCSKCGLTEWLGEPAPLELDHINGITTDNRIDNLRILCSNCHALTDNYCGKNQVRHKAHLLKLANRAGLNPAVGRLPGSSPGVSTTYCIDCGKPINKRSKRCNACNHPTKIQWPSKEELIKLLWRMPSSTLATEFGVTDNAIGKHCKKYGIEKPSRGYWRKVETIKKTI